MASESEKLPLRDHPFFTELARAREAKAAGQHEGSMDHMIYAVIQALRMDRDAADHLASKIETRICERMLTREPSR